MKSGKAAEVDGILTKFWKSKSQALHSKLHELLVCCRKQGELPRDLRDAVIVKLYKNKGKCSIVLTSGGSLCSPSQEKSLLECS